MKGKLGLSQRKVIISNRTMHRKCTREEKERTSKISFESLPIKVASKKSSVVYLIFKYTKIRLHKWLIKWINSKWTYQHMDRERDSNIDWSAAWPSRPCNEREKDVKLHIFENELNKSFFHQISITNYLPSNINDNLSSFKYQWQTTFLQI